MQQKSDDQGGKYYDYEIARKEYSVLEYSWGREGNSGDKDYYLVDKSTGYLYYDFD